jgi:hypothetical protein
MALLFPLLALSIWCGCKKNQGATSSTSTSYPPPSLSGPEGDGGVPPGDATPGDDPFDAGGLDAADTPDAAPCDEMVGDFGACSAASDGGVPTCLTAARCQQLPQYLLPRAAGYAMSCVDGLPSGCTPGAIGDCFVTAAAQSCTSAAPGTPPCDTVATLCSGGDPWGVVGACLAMAPALTASATSALQACLQDGGTCDPGALGGCAAGLFP